jgi:DNA-binding NtrC family response regulator
MDGYKGIGDDAGLLKKPMVAIVDDEAPLLRALRRLLLDEECAVYTTNDPVAFAEEVSGLPDLAVVVSDCQMGLPIDGYFLLRRVEEVRPETTRIMMSGSHRLLEGVSHYFLDKPIESSVFQQAVRRGIEDYFGRLAQGKR